MLIFAGKYIDDFKFVEGKELKFGKVLEFDGVSVDQCAKLCIEEESVNCRSFAYCGNYTKCKLISSTPKQQGSGSLTPSEFCSLYISMHQKYYNTLSIYLYDYAFSLNMQFMSMFTEIY